MFAMNRFANERRSWLLRTAGAALLLNVAVVLPRAAAQEVGVPTVGAMGITETVEQIMAREEAEGSTMLREGDFEKELPYPDRSLLPQNPDSPELSQWPPAPAGDETFHNVGPGHHGAPHSPQTVGTNVLATQISETPGFIPPDTEAAVGTDQIVVIVNGRVKTLSKTTGAADGALSATTDSFFSSVRNGSGTSDPRVRFDRITNRWFISIVNVSTPNRILLAVSSGAHISSSSSFTFYQFQHDLVGTTPNTDTGGFADYDTLGVDANAVYLGANIFTGSYHGTTGYVVKKTSVLSGGPIVVTPFRQLATAGGAGPFSPSGPDNDDPNATEGYFVGSDNISFGKIAIRRVSTPGGTPTLGAIIQVTVPSTTNPIATPASGSSNGLDALDDRHFNAMIHKNRIDGTRTLWLAHNIQVNTSGVASNSGGRNGSRWYQIGSLTGAPTLIQSGTLFDSAASSPRNFWIPSVAMSGQGHMVIGASAAGAAEHAEVAAAGRLRSDALGTTQAPTTLVVSSGNYNIQSGGTQRWGDYSHTFVDPVDDQTIWTSQEYCNTTNSWGIRVTKLIAPGPAAPTTCAPSSIGLGATSVNVTVTGVSNGSTEFFDTDSTYTARLTPVVNGGGVTVNSVTWNSPTQFVMNIDVSAGASSGARTLTVTNPDGQSATSATTLITLTSGGCTGTSIVTNPANKSVCGGVPVSFTVVASGTAPINYQWRKNTVDIGGATSATYTINAPVTGDAGSYDCVVSNACGSVTSNAATLTVTASPVINGQPASQIANVGDAVSFTVTPQGQFFNYTYQWRKNAVNLNDSATIGGTQSNSLNIDPVAQADAGNYDCVVTSVSTGCSTNSNVAVLTVNSGIPCPSDLNGDHAVNLSDLSLLLSNFGKTPATHADGDIDGNNIVDLADLSILLSAFGTSCP